MEVFLVAEPTSSLFSTDIPTRSVREGEQKIIETCACYARSVHCVGCETIVGYHVRQVNRIKRSLSLCVARRGKAAAHGHALVSRSPSFQPCTICGSAEHNGHFWLFTAAAVTSTLREGITWRDLPYNGAEDPEPAAAAQAPGGPPAVGRGGAAGVSADVANGGGNGACEGSSPMVAVEAMAAAAEEDTCAVCASTPMWRPTRFAACGHVFCFGCASREVDMRGSCPLDRRPATREQLILLDEGGLHCS